MRIALADLPSRAGTHIGVSSWHRITQEQVQLFADATGDHQWIHLDPQRAAGGPFGGTIAHGYLTLALTPLVLEEVVQLEGSAATVNYGIDRLRFPAPVPVGARVRASIDLAAAEPIAGGVQCVWKLAFEVEGSPKPACVAEIVFRYLAG